MAEQLSDHAHPTTYWHALDDGRVQCDVCPRACRLREGQRGVCFVRGRVGDEVALLTYGRSSGYCVDPVEKKPLDHFLPGTSVLSFGTAGCNLACRFCQNWDISKSKEIDTLADAVSPETVPRIAFDGANASPIGDERIAFSAATDVDREDWGLTWYVALETGGMLVGQKVRIELNVQAVATARP